ncbi:hypothetical protein [Stenotrophomonas rhizophila]|uniref:hypothetical protein n=1 Tax=Stenotrophomonas rhizophila TaxID=216778 RepID=UPI003397360B
MKPVRIPARWAVGASVTSLPVHSPVKFHLDHCCRRSFELTDAFPQVGVGGHQISNFGLRFSQLELKISEQAAELSISDLLADFSQPRDR